jgi:hypothetical protein
MDLFLERMMVCEVPEQAGAHRDAYERACDVGKAAALAWSGPVRNARERLTGMAKAFVQERNSYFTSIVKDWRVVHG